ncbi:MAG TPA: MraY family glycosyltransferase [Pirellulales bacterium]|nr:MraY family glycosyltransferase [Pirellulales bacterium]
MIAFGVALAGTLLLTPLARQFAWWLDTVDYSDGRRKLHPRPVATLGGVAVFASLTAAVAVMFGVGSPPAFIKVPWPLPMALVLSAGVACLVGFCDDQWGLRVRWKLLGQFLAALPLVLSGHQLERVELAGFVIELGWWGFPLTICWLVAGANAMNFLDGMDGLASTLGLIIAACVGVIAHRLGHGDAAILCAVLAGGLAGFLFYNWTPATIYLGDAGSMVVGIWLAHLALASSDSPEIGPRWIVPLALLAVPIADVVLAVARRTLNGLPFWIADRAHVHHRLQDRGCTNNEIVGLLALVCLVDGAIAYLAAVRGRELLATGALIASVVPLVRFRLIGHHECAALTQFLGRGLLRLAGRMSSGLFTPSLPSPCELEQMPPGGVWLMFVSEIERHLVEQCELLTGGGDGRVWRQQWGASAAHGADGEHWSLELRFDAPGGHWCKLRLVAREGQATQPLNWLSLLDVLRLFGKFWASHPDRLSVGAPRLFERDERTMLTPGRDDHRQAA